MTQTGLENRQPFRKLLCFLSFLCVFFSPRFFSSPGEGGLHCEFRSVRNFLCLYSELPTQLLESPKHADYPHGPGVFFSSWLSPRAW